MYSRRLLKDILGWEVDTWKQAIFLWDRLGPDLQGARVLEIGAADGGLSLYFALKGCQVVCSDLNGPTEKARDLHRAHGVADRIRYAAIDATAIDAPAGAFDVVAFKSVLGGVGTNDQYERQEQAVAEMHRVLKPGGSLLLAENMTASRLHRWFRRRFVPWGRRWRYLNCSELERLLSLFREVHVDFYGFFAVFGRTEFQRSLLHLPDVVVGPLLGRGSKYLACGVARK